MNRERRQRLAEIVAKIEESKADIERVRDDEQETFDNMPVSIQAGERGDKSQAAIDALDEAINALEEVFNSIETAKE